MNNRAKKSQMASSADSDDSPSDEELELADDDEVTCRETLRELFSFVSTFRVVGSGVGIHTIGFLTNWYFWGLSYALRIVYNPLCFVLGFATSFVVAAALVVILFIIKGGRRFPRIAAFVAWLMIGPHLCAYVRKIAFFWRWWIKNGVIPWDYPFFAENPLERYIDDIDVIEYAKETFGINGYSSTFLSFSIGNYTYGTRHWAFVTVIGFMVYCAYKIFIWIGALLKQRVRSRRRAPPSKESLSHRPSKKRK